jgi:hypothetical protein
MHFEELWTKCEALFQESVSDASASGILEELELKISLYQAIGTKEIPEEEKQQLKVRLMGEILMTITHLSLKDNIDVFEALVQALQWRSAQHYQQKYPVP